MSNIHDLCRDWTQEVIDDIARFYDVYQVGDVEEVETKARDGFIPYTDGGFEAIGFASLHNAHSSGCIPDIIQPYLDRDLEDMAQQFEEEHKIPFDDVIQDELHPLYEEACDYENSWLSEGGTYFYKVRVLIYLKDNHRNESGEDEAYFLAALNTDFEYGRDDIPWLACYGTNPQKSQWLFERNIPLKDLEYMDIQALANEAIGALS